MRIISIDGGGILGLSSLSFLAEFENHFKIKLSERFDMFCGTSTGAIIALGLASGMEANDLKTLYLKMSKLIFPKPTFWRSAKIQQFINSRYDNRVLKGILNDVFKDTTVFDIEKSGKFLIIPSLNLSTAYPRVFKTDHSPNFGRDSKYKLSQIALASASAPTYFPILNLKSEFSGSIEKFIDGGLFANNPAMLGYIEAKCELNIDPNDINILSISTPRKDLTSLNINKKLNAGIINYNSKLVEYPINATTELMHQMLLRLFKKESNSKQYLRVNFPNPDKIAFDSSKNEDMNSLNVLGVNTFHSNDMKESLKIFLEEN